MQQVSDPSSSLHHIVFVTLKPCLSILPKLCDTTMVTCHHIDCQKKSRSHKKVFDAFRQSLQLTNKFCKAQSAFKHLLAFISTPKKTQPVPTSCKLSLTEYNNLLDKLSTLSIFQLRKLVHTIYSEIFQLSKLKISLEKMTFLIFLLKTYISEYGFHGHVFLMYTGVFGDS